MMQSFVPVNEIESMLIKARDGLVPMRDLMIALMTSDIVLPSGSEVLANGSGLEPLIFPKEQVQMVACFTDMSRMGEYAKLTPYFLVLKGENLLRGIPRGHGVVINPGQEFGFDISSDGIARILNEFSR